MVRNQQKRQAEADLHSLQSEYKTLRPVTESFCSELVHQLSRLLGDANIALGFPIQHRVKQWESLVDKLERLGLHIKSINDIQDLVGLRVILLFKRDVERVCSIIAENLTVSRRYDTGERLREDQFGYSSIHFVVTLPKTWLTVPTLSKMVGLKAEIQVRTLTQHIWAEASHKLQYKREESVPSSLLRSIYRVSALLETVDLEFERVLGQRDSYRNLVDVSGLQGVLNVDLLEKTLDSLLPAENKSESESYAELLVDLLAFEVDTQQKLMDLVQDHLEGILAEDKKRVKEGIVSVVEPEEARRVTQGVYFTHVGLTRKALSLQFADEYEHYARSKPQQ